MVVRLIFLLLSFVSYQAHATSYMPMHDADLFDQAEYVLTGQVESTRVTAENAMTYTLIDISVGEIIKGDALPSRIVIQQLGGHLPNGSGQRISAAPEFAVQQKVLLFVNEAANGRFSISQFMLGVFHEVTHGDQVILQRDLSDALAFSPAGTARRGQLSARDKTSFLDWLRARSQGQVAAEDYWSGNAYQARQDEGVAQQGYTNIGGLTPVRWFDFDEPSAVTWVADTTPEADMQAAGYTSFQAALLAWNADAGSNINLSYGGQVVARNGLDTSDGKNAILFNDPNNEIGGSFSCSSGGTLAIGGPRYSFSGRSYKGRTYYPISEGDVVTQNGAGCFFIGNANKNGDEVFAHEVGHALGLGHSTSGDALMRASAHGDGRGAQLAADDRAAVAEYYEETSPPGPEIEVSPTTLSFGSVQITQNASSDLVISNTGASDLTISGVSVTGADQSQFTADGRCNATVITSGQSCTLSVVFAPASPVGAKSATLVINSDDADESVLNVALSGNATAAPAPEIEVSPGSVDFGNQDIGTQSQRNITVINQGDAALTISSVSIGGAAASAFTQNDGCLNANLSNGQSCTVAVTFGPASPAGSKQASLTVVSNDSDEGSLNIALQGNATVAPTPEIQVTPQAVDFGNVPLGSQLKRSVTVTNQGAATLQLSSVTLSGADSAEFSEDGGCASQSLTQGASCVIEVTFAPASRTGGKTAALSIDSNDPDEGTVNVTLSGTAVTPPAPDIDVTPSSVDFGSVHIGSSEVSGITIRNLGNADLSITAIAVSGPHADNFSQNGGCDAVILSSGQSCLLQVSFSPAGAAGARQALLAIQSNDADEATVNIGLAGQATPAPEPEITTTPATLDFMAVTVGSVKSLMLTVSNQGTAPLEINSTLINGQHAAEFAQDGGCDAARLAPGETCSIRVDFAPLGQPGSRQAALVLGSNDVDEASLAVPLSGTAVPAPAPEIDVSPLQLDFGTVAVNALSPAQEIRIQNLGNGELMITNVAFQGLHSGQYQTNGGCDNLTLKQTESCVMSVLFKPDHNPGIKQGSLVISSNDADESSVAISLTGNAQHDADADGVTDAIEDAAPNNGDGNADGIKDSAQVTVTSLLNSSSEYITLSVDTGVMRNLRILGHPDLSTSPVGIVFNEDFVGFDIEGLAPGGSVEVSLVLHSGNSVNRYFKYSGTPDVPSPHFYDFSFDGTTGAVIQGNVITLHLTDGLRGDGDLNADGRIVDPGAPASAPEEGSGGGGGGCSMGPSGQAVDLSMLLILLLSAGLIWLPRHSRQRHE